MRFWFFFTFNRWGPEEVNYASELREQAVRPTSPKLNCKLRRSLERPVLQPVQLDVSKKSRIFCPAKKKKRSKKEG